ncbi:hypothetical protein MA16_Dca021669 [Dendrobium catenatum]|uniref:Uncharacterized protein n=1 Tax=Dendrobium catenatum TaxID=906689 RepID=A0A2I0V759_9ASPA|nr:hypothetical protein MA16_Dca021669 [Dendrobium catenatum]
MVGKKILAEFERNSGGGRQTLVVVGRNSGGVWRELRRWSAGTPALVGRDFGSGRRGFWRWSAGTPAVVGRDSGGGRQELRRWSAGNSGGGRWKESSQIPPFFYPSHEKSEGYL